MSDQADRIQELRAKTAALLRAVALALAADVERDPRAASLWEQVAVCMQALNDLSDRLGLPRPPPPPWLRPEAGWRLSPRRGRRRRRPF